MIILKHHYFNTDINKHKVKYIIKARIPKLLQKNFFSSHNIRMSRTSININDKKIKKVTFTIKTRKYLI